MMIAEIVLSAILFIGALLHVYGSFVTFAWASPELVWSIGSSGLAVLLSALAVLRSRRPRDRALSAIVLSGCVGWAAIVLAFGLVIGNPADPRVLYNLVVSLALAAFALRGVWAVRQWAAR